MSKTPYSDDYDPLPPEEIRRMLSAYLHKAVGGKTDRWANKITMNDVHRETRINPHILHAVVRGLPMPTDGRHTFGKKRQQRLSRFLMKAACGMIVKKDGKMVHLDEPTKPMPVVRRVKLGITGAILTKGEQLPAPRSMPKFLDIFKQAPTIQLPKGLR